MELKIGGQCRDMYLKDRIRHAIDNDERVECNFRYMEDEELVSFITSASLVVLPYKEVLNSGAMILALSLSRPVLVPANTVNLDIQREVGVDWVITYEGDLSPCVLNNAMDSAVRLLRQANAAPNLTGRSWSDAGVRFASAYTLALNIRNGFS
ncbi:hypothetical protein J8M97_18295 [Gordonia polyisoprenivorans]|uniref:hypothetical protein n=1 Tax=Gordonia polyisoprenivorans TaxID=84595 RepID=UPI001B8CD714|nr:hypothetical protein [Gordonia polyisoprenivorans]QUD81706.1 hypothetical protein J8M97_18295 [Gordonia polyisoprenivorans]